jgi:hypothetical protein
VNDARGSLERVVAGLVERVERRFYGKYRGFVVDDADPAQLGRLQLRVPSVFGNDVVSGWAHPCVPYGGTADQGLLFLPKREAGVWVEFEEGDLEFPIWVGTFWIQDDGSGLPRPNAADGSEADAVQDPVTAKILKTEAGHTLQFEDAEGAESVLLLDGHNGHRIRFDADGVTVVDGVNAHKVELTADGVAIEDGVNGHTVELTADGVAIVDGVNQHKIVLGASGIAIGADAAQSVVLGDAFKAAVTAFVTDLGLHTHVCAAPASPSGPPVKPMTLDVALSTTVKVE